MNEKHRMKTEMSRLGHALAFGLLFACAAPGVVSAAEETGPQCALHVEAKLPLIEVGGRYVVVASANGVDLPLLVDTGAEKTVLTPDAADALHLPRDTAHTENIAGVGERATPEYPRIIDSLRFGPAEWTSMRVPVAKLDAHPTTDGVPFAGLLGANLLSRYDVELDFPARTMTLWSASNCSGKFAPWTGTYQAYSPEYTPEHRFILDVALGQTPLRAVLDTGAMPSLVTLEAAVRGGMDTATSAQDPVRSGRGVSGVPFEVRIHRFDRFRVGTRTFHNVRMEVGDTPLRADMLLEMDFLKWRRVWLSYSTGWVFMQWDGDRSGVQQGKDMAATAAPLDPTGQLASLKNENGTGALPAQRLSEFSTHTHITYQSVPRVVQSTRLQPPGRSPGSIQPSWSGDGP